MQPTISPSGALDPLGLKVLGRYIIELNDAVKTGDLPAAQALTIALFQAHGEMLESYDQLVDRYRLLKQSSRHLAEEVAWLRDQCDDFAGERQELKEKLEAERS